LNQNDNDYIRKIRKLKQLITPGQLAVGRALCFLPFVNETFKYEYEQEPDYNLLKHLLLQALLETGKSPDKDFDWTTKNYLSLEKSID